MRQYAGQTSPSTSATSSETYIPTSSADTSNITASNYQQALNQIAGQTSSLEQQVGIGTSSTSLSIGLLAVGAVAAWWFFFRK
jgi:hypothetical protein